MDIFGLNPINPDDLIETDLESEFDDMEEDKTFEVSPEVQKQMDLQDALDEDEMDETAVVEKKRKKGSTGGNGSNIKKKDREFDEKKKIAKQVSKYPNIFDICNKSFADKHLTHFTWQKFATTIGLPVNTCVSHWNSLKRSAKYYSNEQKIPCKSSASADEMSVLTYRSNWPFADVMADVNRLHCPF